ncbi:MAG: short-chain fatty acid transporter, partial [Flavobacteriales bacterium]|nr:short-chain fatty acid transporter [Flavobacteriales bacterium]
MRRSDRLIGVLRAVLPSPFTIAILLSLLAFALALLLTGGEKPLGGHALDLLGHWERGLWDPPLLVFTMQMMLILVLGHAIALSRPVEALIDSLLRFCRDTPSSAATVTLLTVLVSLFNWGLGLVFGAIFARKVAEHAVRRNFGLNYGLIGAAGYSGLLVWHGGISGSAPIKVAEAGHLKALMAGSMSPEALAGLPERIGFEQTVFSPANLLLCAVLVLLLPAVMFLLGRKDRSGVPHLRPSSLHSQLEGKPHGAERLDHSWVLAGGIAAVILIYGAWSALSKYPEQGLAFITPNAINLLLFGGAIALHGNFHRFLAAVDEAIGGAAGILVQFPLYFGIMGLMKGSGLVEQFAQFVVDHATAGTYPLFTFLSAAVVNVFVPSGGGQWAVQGPLIMQAGQALGMDLPKGIMAMAYGDQLTN